jgi:hypothetical protein
MSKNKKYYLIKEETSFYDGHGTPDDGGTTIKVEYTSEYNDLDLSQLYSEDLEVLEDDYDEDFSEADGYNYDFTTLQIKEISLSEYEEYKEVINTYTEILNNF